MNLYNSSFNHLNNRCYGDPHLADEETEFWRGSDSRVAHHPSAGEQTRVCLGSELSLPHARGISIRVTQVSGPFSYCFWGFRLNISGASWAAPNVATGTQSASSEAKWSCLSRPWSCPSLGAGRTPHPHRQVLGQAASEGPAGVQRGPSCGHPSQQDEGGTTSQKQEGCAKPPPPQTPGQRTL